MALLALHPYTSAASVQVSMDTSALVGTNAQLAFDLIDGDGTANNWVTVGGLFRPHHAGFCSHRCGVAGTLPGPVTISDSSFFNELLQSVTLGHQLQFSLDLSSASSGGPVPDGFSIFLLDAQGAASLVATNLLGDALLFAELVGNGQVNVLAAYSTTPSIAVTVSIAQPVPEPSALLLFSIAACTALLRRQAHRGAG